jgi:hypothetical protein
VGSYFLDFAREFHHRPVHDPDTYKNIQKEFYKENTEKKMFK